MCSSDLCVVVFVFFFFSSRRRHTRCADVTGVQTCALPISTKAGGANIHSMYSIQTACNLAMITRMLRSDTKLRQMMENLLDRLTIYNGLPGNVLTTDMGSWVPWTWVHPTLQAARSHGICIVAPGRHTLETGTIMQHAGATVRDKETLFRINQVRMSFGVTYIRELYKGDAFDWKYCEPPPHRGDWRSWPKQTQQIGRAHV